MIVDHQPQMFFGVGSDDRTSIINATVGLGKAAKVFNVPTVLTTGWAARYSPETARNSAGSVRNCSTLSGMAAP